MGRSKLGGVPDWIKPRDPPTCAKCAKPMALALQVSAPFEDYAVRMLYLFHCGWSEDHSTWKVLRQQSNETLWKKAPRPPLASAGPALRSSAPTSAVQAAASTSSAFSSWSVDVSETDNATGGASLVKEDAVDGVVDDLDRLLKLRDESK